MKHLFKWPTVNADLFISKIDVDSSIIEFSVRNKETGELQEPFKKEEFIVKNDKIFFDTTRSLEIPLVKFIVQTLT